MHGIPSGYEAPFLRGVKLHQVCVGENEVILHFEMDTTLTVECPTRWRTGEDRREHLDPSAAAVDFVGLVGANVQDVFVLSPTELELAFANATSVVLIDDSDSYESFTVRHGDHLLVV